MLKIVLQSLNVYKLFTEWIFVNCVILQINFWLRKASEAVGKFVETVIIAGNSSYKHGAGTARLGTARLKTARLKKKTHEQASETRTFAREAG